MKVIKYPLGNSLYAYVNTRGGKTLINIRHFRTKIVKSKKHPKGIKKVVPSSRGITLDNYEFQRMLRIAKNLSIDLYLKSMRMNKHRMTSSHFAHDEQEEKEEEEEEEEREEEVNEEKSFNDTLSNLSSSSSSSSTTTTLYPPLTADKQREREREHKRARSGINV